MKPYEHALVTPCATLEDWKRLRGSYIGGSDAASILGLSPYRTIGETWLAKVRAQEALEAGEEASDPDIETRFTRWGRRWEGIVLDEYQDVTGFDVERTGLTLYRHPELPFIGGTLDAQALTPAGDKRIVEAKTTDAWVQWRDQVWGPSGSDIVPDWYLVQLVVYLIVRRHEGYAMGDFAVLIGGNDHRIFHIEYDNDLADIVVDALTKFWKLVTERRAPEFDYMHKNAVALQRRIYNKVEGTSIVVPANYRVAPSHPTVLELMAQHDEYAAVETEAKKRKEAFQAELLSIAGNNAMVEIEGTNLALRRRNVKGYHVEAYDVPPRIQLDLLPRNAEKRARLLNEFSTDGQLPGHHDQGTGGARGALGVGADSEDGAE